MGRELTIAATCDIKVTSSSWVSFCTPGSTKMASRMCLIVPIWQSQTPPKWDTCGGLNCHSQPCSERYLFTDFLSISAKASSNSDFPPTKLLPWSHLNHVAGPRMERNLLKAHMNELASTVLRSSMWIALLARHVKTRPQRLLPAAPPLVCLVCTVHGPNTSKPMLVKGGRISALSGGRSAIFCSCSLLQVTHELIRLATAPCPPTSQYPAFCRALWVICLPW